MVLPQKCIGKHWVKGIVGQNAKLTDIVCVEAVHTENSDTDNHWVIKSNRKYKIFDKDGKILQSVKLENMRLYKIQSCETNSVFTLFSEALSDDRKMYTGYVVTRPETVISIGRDEDNAICFANKYTSHRHAQLIFSNGCFYIKNLNSTNNTYVNNFAVTEKRLTHGDVVYIMGLRIIIANKSFYINNPDGNVNIRFPELKKIHLNIQSLKKRDVEFEDVPIEYYYPALRYNENSEEFVLRVDTPPAQPTHDEIPLIMTIGPSLTMGMASAASGAMTVYNAVERGNFLSAMPSLVMCISMLLGTMMWPFITKMFQKKLAKNREVKRQQSYMTYLCQLESDVQNEIAKQENLLRKKDVNAKICSQKILGDNPSIWDYTNRHDDFLRIRLGISNLLMNAQIQYSERRFSVEQDNLIEEMHKFGEKKRILRNVPLFVPLTDKFVFGMYGNRKKLYEYTKSIILQLATLHSYNEVKLVLIYNETDSAELSFARFLPHVMNEDRTFRYIATNSEETQVLSLALNPIIEYRKQLSDTKLDEEKDYYVIISLDKDLAIRTECVRRILDNKKFIKFSYISLCEKMNDIPKECLAWSELGDNTATFASIENGVKNTFEYFVEQDIDSLNIDYLSNVLANTFVDTNGTDYKMPEKYTFFDMLDIGKVEQLNIAENWQKNDPTKSLAAVIGVDKYGEPFKLDLHEKVHGSHGLVAGMTGSGKSEFIITYILSMAISYHPSEVAFILIDYKGGGMAKSFEKLPHTSGIITNLDGNAIRRSLMSMRSELHRREKIFAEVSRKCNISNIDIYKYQSLYRAGKVSEPLPHLFIISDEFAELKKEQPEFMSELISTARVGRSLGVHLILATQKPGGIVDDQIRSNSRFKVCLKVQDSGDSHEMLGLPDAASLKETGRFYLQVGYNEIFEIGQSAWAGAPYYPSQKTLKDDGGVSVIDNNGRVIANADINKFPNIKNPQKQLDVLTGYIAKYCSDEKISQWKMWLEPIGSKVYVDVLAKEEPYKPENRFELSPVVGKCDDPSHQRQFILRIPFSSDGNVVVYGAAGSGKTMFMEALCYSLMREHKPEEVNIFILDFGTETFGAFSDSPFVGDVIYSHESEKISNLFKMLEQTMQNRKKSLSEFGGEFLQYNLSSNKSIPNILVLINNYAAFKELYENDAEKLNHLTREGTKYGIYFVLGCTGVNNVKFSLLQNFRLLYCLQLNNADDYTVVLGKTDGLTPEKYRGRGMVRVDKDLLCEFQTAMITSVEPHYTEIKSFCQKQRKYYEGYQPLTVPILPEIVSVEYLKRYIVDKGDVSKVPVGVAKKTLEPSYYDFSENVVSLILSENRKRNAFVRQLGILLSDCMGIKTFFLSDSEKEDNELSGFSNLVYANSAEEKNEAVNTIYDLLTERQNHFESLSESQRKAEKLEPIAVIIQSLSDLKEELERFKKPPEERQTKDDTPFNRIQLAMKLCSQKYEIYFIVCSDVKSISQFGASDWYKDQVKSSQGIWIGDGIRNQFKLNVNSGVDNSQTMSSEYGYNIYNRNATLIKLLQ